MSGQWIVAILLVVVPLAIFGALVAKGKRRADRLREAIQGLPDFVDCEVLTSPDIAIAASQSAGLFAIAWFSSTHMVNTKTLRADALVRVDIERTEGGSTTKKSGFATYSTTDYADAISLCVHFRDQSVPFVRIPMYARIGDKSAVTKLAESSAFEKARMWSNMVVATASSYEAKSLEMGAIAGETPSRDLAAEIRNLHALLHEGALTEEEFHAAKSKVLGH